MAQLTSSTREESQATAAELTHWVTFLPGLTKINSWGG